MPPLLDDLLVSPELVLVDPGLRARTRAAMVVPYPVRVPTPEPPSDTVIVVPEPQRRRSPFAAPVGALVATAAVSLVVTAFSGGDEADGVAAVKSVREIPSTTTASGAPAQGSRALRTGQLGPGGAVERATESETTVTFEVESSRSLPTVRSAQASAPASASSSARHLPTSATTLIWPRSAQASAYHVELIRNGAVIFAARSKSAELAVSRRWSRDGVRYALQPEDHVYVWPVVAGRRSDEPVVNGVLALDMTLISRFIELSWRQRAALARSS